METVMHSGVSSSRPAETAQGSLLDRFFSSGWLDPSLAFLKGNQ